MTSSFKIYVEGEYMDNNDNEYTIYCSRCGAEMKNNSRYCMKCGNLNYDHEANQNMKKIMGKEAEIQEYHVGGGNIINNTRSNTPNISVSNNTGSSLLCFLFTYGLLIISVLGIVFTFLVKSQYELTTFLTSGFAGICILICLMLLYTYALELVYIKSNHRWWSGFIPIYNTMVLSDIAFNSSLLGLLVLIPGVNLIYSIILFYKLGKDFSYSGILTAIFPFIFVPLMGFSTHTYRGYTFAYSNKDNMMEKIYKYKKIFLGTSLLFIIGCLISIGYTNKDYLMDVKNNKYYYVLAANKMVKDVKKKIESGKLECDFTYDSTKDVYYFRYGDVGDKVYLPLYIMVEPLHGYVKVDNSSGVSKYYVTISDGSNGFYEVLDSEISRESVVEYDGDYSLEVPNLCKM